MICHHYKCIFVHIPKNAGQSIEHAFLRQLGLTWETRAPLLLRPNDRPELGPPRLAHLTAEEYVRCQYLPQEMFDDYFKFAFVRNPWDRMVSFYKYLGFDGKCDFKTFLLKEYKNKVYADMHWFLRPQSDFVSAADGSPLMDFLGRFETLQADFVQVCKKIALPLTPLPHINKSKAKKGVAAPASWRIPGGLLGKRGRQATVHHDRYQDYYDQEALDFVAEIYKSDIKAFNYDF